MKMPFRIGSYESEEADPRIVHLLNENERLQRANRKLHVLLRAVLKKVGGLVRVDVDDIELVDDRNIHVETYRPPGSFVTTVRLKEEE